MIEEPYPPYLKNKYTRRVLAFSLPLIQGAHNYVACYTPAGDETKPPSLREGLETILSEPSGTIEYEIEKDLKAESVEEFSKGTVVESCEEARRTKFDACTELAIKLIGLLRAMGAESMKLPVKIDEKKYFVICRPVNKEECIFYNKIGPCMKQRPDIFAGKEPFECPCEQFSTEVFGESIISHSDVIKAQDVANIRSSKILKGVPLGNEIRTATHESLKPKTLLSRVIESFRKLWR